MSRSASEIMSNYGRHVDHIGVLVASFFALPPDVSPRLRKPTTNLFRSRETAATGLDASGLTHVLAIDTDERWADVEGMCTYEDLVRVTLPRGLMPTVVPQLKTITVGGAVSGLGIESTSFRAGLPHESVIDMDVLCGDGLVRRAEPLGENAELFRCFPNSYGSLGYATRLKIALEPVASFVHLTHLRYSDLADAARLLAEITATGSHAGQPVSFLDAVVFSPTQVVVTLGRELDLAEAKASGMVPSSYTGERIYYRSLLERNEDLLRIDHYLWRWDTDWFWCSRAFGLGNPVVRRLWPQRYRRSDVYRRLITADERLGLSATARRLSGRPDIERVIQDVEVPVERLAEFLEWFHAHVPLSPIWLCPLRLTSPTSWPLYPLEPGRTYVNVGFWGTVPRDASGETGATNRAIEAEVARLGGHKSLYSEVFYPRDEFEAAYGGAALHHAKQLYDPENRLGTLYDKVVARP